jgi:hypothetical protein
MGRFLVNRGALLKIKFLARWSGVGVLGLSFRCPHDTNYCRLRPKTIFFLTMASGRRRRPAPPGVALVQKSVKSCTISRQPDMPQWRLLGGNRHGRLRVERGLYVGIWCLFIAQTGCPSLFFHVAASIRLGRNGNILFDPEVVPIPICSIPPFQPQTGDDYRPPATRTASNETSGGNSFGYCPVDAPLDWPDLLSSLNITSLDKEAELVHQLAVQYAPVLFFHPLEQFTLSAVDRTFSDPKLGFILGPQSTIRPGQNASSELHRDGKSQLVSETLDLPTLFHTTRDVYLGLRKHLYRFGRELSAEYIAGDGFYRDTAGSLIQLSRAVIYYNWYQYQQNLTSGLVFNYYFYYPFRGAANLGVVETNRTTANTVNSNTGRKEAKYTSFRSAPFGMHESDWQSVSVLVCIPTSAQAAEVMRPSFPSSVTEEADSNGTVGLTAPISVAYRQVVSSDGASTRLISDCTVGECVLYQNSVHPVGFVADGTHHTYPIAASNLIVREFRTEFMFDLHGVYSIDRTNFRDFATGGYRMFYPNNTNLVRHFKPSDIDTTRNNVTLLWQGYGGQWGCTCLLSDVDLRFDLSHPAPPVCYDESGSQVEECPTRESRPLWYIVNQMIRAFPDGGSSLLGGTKLLLEAMLDNWMNASPYGPPTDHSFYNWMAPVNVPLQVSLQGQMSAAAYCDRLISGTNPERNSVFFDTVPLRNNVIGLIAVASTIVIVHVVLSTAYPLGFWNGRALIELDEGTGVARPPGRTSFILIFGPCLTYLAFYFLTSIGVILYFLGYANLVDLLESSFGMDLSDVEQYSYLFGMFVFLTDSAMVIVVWIPSRTVWLRTKASYFHLVGNEEEHLRYMKRAQFGARPSFVLFQVFYGVLFNSLILANLTVLIGCLNVGIAYAAGHRCNSVVGALDGICLGVEEWSIAIKCGQDFQGFCSKWASVNSVGTLWGSFMIIIGHYYLINAAGAASKSFKSLPDLLKLLPTRELYLMNVAILVQKAASHDSDNQHQTNAEKLSDSVDEVPVSSITNGVGICSKASFHPS